LFQARDLQLLGYGKKEMDREAVLDQFWGMYEIMGVSLVDMHMWKWLYAHPKANAEELREAVLQIAAEVWNKYYEPVLGEKDCILLAIYSHMVNSPMYLPNYPIGHIVQFQLEEALADKEGREWAEAYERWYRLGRLTPQQWMKQAVNGKLSVRPVIERIKN
jgi:oligoendopeptidase F